MNINQSFKGASTPAILHIPSSVRSSVCRLARLSVLASAAAVAIAASPAYSYTITDAYSGGNNTYNSPNDVIGSNTFNTTDAVLTRSGLNNSILKYYYQYVLRWCDWHAGNWVRVFVLFDHRLDADGTVGFITRSVSAGSISTE